MEKSEVRQVLATNPYAAGRTEATERYGRLAKNAAKWQGITYFMLLCCAACVYAVIHMASTVTKVPYMVQVNRHGYYVAVAPIKPGRIDDQSLIETIINRYREDIKKNGEK